VKALEEEKTSEAKGSVHVRNGVPPYGTAEQIPIAREERPIRKGESILPKALKR
jgi:hypothetical protein